MAQNKFDLVMDYIDENITSDTETIKKGILNLAGMNSNTFGHFFSGLTGDTLGSYIRSRRLFYAANELQKCPQKPICDIALEFGYSEQSAFTRAFTTQYNFSPSDLRKKNTIYVLENNKYHLEDFNTNSSDSRSDRIWREFERVGYMGDDNLKFLESVEEGHKEFGFDYDTCYAIADLAEHLEIPVDALMRTCFDLVVDIKSDPHYLPNSDRVAMSLGVKSDVDLQKICEHYACKYYELNYFMVDAYYDLQI